MANTVAPWPCSWAISSGFCAGWTKESRVLFSTLAASSGVGILTCTKPSLAQEEDSTPSGTSSTNPSARFHSFAVSFANSISTVGVELFEFGACLALTQDERGGTRASGESEVKGLHGVRLDHLETR